jgi:hypothetical protein
MRAQDEPIMKKRFVVSGPGREVIRVVEGLTIDDACDVVGAEWLTSNQERVALAVHAARSDAPTWIRSDGGVDHYRWLARWRRLVPLVVRVAEIPADGARPRCDPEVRGHFYLPETGAPFLLWLGFAEEDYWCDRARRLGVPDITIQCVFDVMT